MTALADIAAARKRLRELNGFSLMKGSHQSLKDGACLMEMVAYVAGEKWSDRPDCACPILTSYAIRLNDRANDETRQLLRPLIMKLLNTRSTKEIEKERYRFLVTRAVTVQLPLLTDALELKAISKKLRSFKSGEWIAMRDYCREIRPTIREAMSKAADAADADAAYASAYASDAADAASAASASADAYAYAYASASAADADAASAAAYAASAADASAYAAYASAYAYAAYAAYASDADADASASADADADAPKAKKWKALRDEIWSEAIKSLEQACEIGAKKKTKKSS